MTESAELYILRDGKIYPATPMEWGRWFENVENRLVEKTDINGASVSTVFMGLDHSHGQGSHKLLFETMVFGSTLNGLTIHTATLGDAKAAHFSAVDRVRRARPRFRRSELQEQRRKARRDARGQGPEYYEQWKQDRRMDLTLARLSLHKRLLYITKKLHLQLTKDAV